MIEQALEIDILKNLSLDMHQGINTVTENVEYLESGIPILQSKHITKGFLNLEDTKYLSEKDYLKYKDKYQANIDDVLVCNIGTIGKSLRIDKAEKFLIAWNLFLIKLDNTKLYSQYFAHYLNHLSDQNYFDKFLTGGTVKFINKKTMGNIQVPILPLPQQQKIANILDAADALRQNDKALIAKYDELTQALFLDMFGDPVSNPKGWEMMKLEGFCEFENGDRSSNYPSGDDIKSSGKLFLSSGDIKKGRFIVKDSKFISQEKYNSLKRGKCYRNDVLMTLRGNGTGKSAIFDCEYEEGFINAQMVIIRPNDKCEPNYLVLQLNNPVVFKRLISFNSGSAQPQLSAQSVKEFKVFVPPVDLQNQFAERVAVIEEQKAIAQKSLEQSERLFNSLLQKAFKGEL